MRSDVIMQDDCKRHKRERTIIGSHALVLLMAFQYTTDNEFKEVKEIEEEIQPVDCLRWLPTTVNNNKLA